MLLWNVLTDITYAGIEKSCRQNLQTLVTGTDQWLNGQGGLILPSGSRTLAGQERGQKTCNCPALEPERVAFDQCKFSPGFACLDFLISAVSHVDNRIAALLFSAVNTVLPVASDMPRARHSLSLVVESRHGAIIPEVDAGLVVLLQVLAVVGVVGQHGFIATADIVSAASRWPEKVSTSNDDAISFSSICTPACLASP